MQLLRVRMSRPTWCSWHGRKRRALSSSRTSFSAALLFCVLAHSPHRTSSKKERLQGYLKAGDLGTPCLSHERICISLRTSRVALTTSDIASIDAAGAAVPEPIPPVAADEKAMAPALDAGLGLPSPVQHMERASVRFRAFRTVFSVFCMLVFILNIIVLLAPTRESNATTTPHKWLKVLANFCFLFSAVSEWVRVNRCSSK